MVCMVNQTAVELLAVSSGSKNNVDKPLAADNSSFFKIPSKYNKSDHNLSPHPSFSPGSNPKTPIPTQSSTFFVSSNCSDRVNRTKSADSKGELVITKFEQGLIFTSFYAGGLAIVMPGSYLCDKFGPTKLVFLGAILNVVGSFITPVVARFLGSISLIIVRFIMGCGQGILVPCMNVLIAHWFPLSEKSTALAIATTGNQISVIVAMLFTAELCTFDILRGWESAFYLYGFLGIWLCVIWMWFVADSPEVAGRIREKELIHIHDGESRPHRSINPKEVPWSRIMTSLAVWSTALCSFSQNFMNVGIIVYLPSYYSRYLKFNITSNGLMSALPFVFQLFTKILFAGIADSLNARKIMSPSSITKLFNLIASVGSGICFLLLPLYDCSDKYFAVFLAVLAIGLSSGFIPGYNISIVCIAPRYTASIASFSRLLGNIASVTSPSMFGFFSDREQWDLAFYTVAFVSISSGILFQFCGSASVQSWALEPNKPPIPPLMEEKEDSVAFLAPNSSAST